MDLWKFVIFILMYTVVLLEANLLSLSFVQKTIINYLFPKDPNITRVRYPNEIQTDAHNVTTLDFIGLTERYGYPAEEHYVKTEDGYILTIHRILGSPLLNSQQRRNVVFLQHGLSGSSDYWVANDAENDLAFLLADKGYDVWFGNVRGNSYCRSHVKLSPRDKDFWKFSFHEVGTRDLPAMIDYILNYTKQKNLIYLGNSMGATVLFVFLSMKPEYNAKIELGILLTPFAMNPEIPLGFKIFQNVGFIIKKFFDYIEVYEVGSLSSTSITIGRTLCADKIITQDICVILLRFFVGSNSKQINATRLPHFFSYYPAGTSVQTADHFFQNVFARKFQTYDYGYFNNYKHYGQATPIMYDLKKVIAPLAIFYSADDILTPKSNVFETARHLSNVILLKEIPYKFFGHVDFITGIDAKTLVYDRIMKLLQEYDTCQKPYV